MGKFIDVILAFCYIFGFSLNGGGKLDSNMAVAVFLFLYAICNISYMKTLVSFFSKSYSQGIIKYYLIINLWIMIVLLVNLQTDYSYMITFLHMFFVVIVGAMLCLYYTKKGRLNNVVNYIVIAFIVQSLIEWAGFLSPSFSALIQTTKNEYAIKKILEYSGVRGNALCGSDFFGLSAAFALVYVVFLSSKNSLFASNRILKLCVFFLLLTGTFFAGRTGYVGLVIVIYHVIKNRRQVFSKTKLNFQEIFSCIMVVGSLLSLITYFIYLYNTDDNFNWLFRWTFQNLFNYAETGSFQSSSTAHLTNDMYFEINPLTFFFGDGLYTMPDGSYYMNTDSGYMRPILYMGVVGFLLMIAMMFSMLKVRKGNEKNLKISILLILFILNYKGEVVMWNMVQLSVFSLYCFQDYLMMFHLKKVKYNVVHNIS